MGASRQIKVGILTAPKIDYEQREHTFLLKNVRIGIGFHWDRKEDQEFAGELEIRSNADGTQTAINTIDLEDYLCSVISSEMNANSPMELLKAHAVISRSWAIRAMQKPNHEGFDVCADDHCQRYEGLLRMNERAVEAVNATRGQVLMFGDEKISMYPIFSPCNAITANPLRPKFCASSLMTTIRKPKTSGTGR